ncbi:MAG: three-Cys-motif partner protein TcmP [Nitrospinae bacterium]|nr:three-Cys-motif partner protein TcmP [Nitrospinota bacterium]
MSEVRLDEIGPWSEVKIEIIRKYASAYTQILSKQPAIKKYIYIDGFAGAGKHLAKGTGDEILGTPQEALRINPPFHEYHFVDLDKNKAELLASLKHGRSDVFVYKEDCNKVLPDQIFPRARYEDFHRALCILDPYGMHLNWEVMYKAGLLKSMDIFINFPIMDINRNVLRNDINKVADDDKVRMTSFWGDESWIDIGYHAGQQNLFGDPSYFPKEKKHLVNAFQDRLKTIAGFSYVPDPMPMLNSSNAKVYWLFFASQQQVAGHIINDIFRKYQTPENKKR